jgi:transcriptional regulator with XRE-family HTH domain
MAKKTAPLLPIASQRLEQLGERLRLARLRRKLTAKQVAERSGMTTVTLRNLERGSSGVTMGAYLAVMQALGVDSDLDLLVQSDPLGRELQDAALSPRVSRPASPSAPPVAAGRAARELDAAAPPVLQEPAVTWAEGARGASAASGSQFVSADDLVKLIKQPQAAKAGRKR